MNEQNVDKQSRRTHKPLDGVRNNNISSLVGMRSAAGRYIGNVISSGETKNQGTQEEKKNKNSWERQAACHGGSDDWEYLIWSKVKTGKAGAADSMKVVTLIYRP